MTNKTKNENTKKNKKQNKNHLNESGTNNNLPKEKKKVGREPKYTYWRTEEGITLIKGWAINGVEKKDIAKNMGIAPQTLSLWLSLFPELKEALKVSRDVADYKVENQTFLNATGYFYIEETPIKLRREFYDENGKKCSEEWVDVVPVKKWKPAEPSIQIYWTKNRMSDRWRDRFIEQNSEVGVEQLVSIANTLKEYKNVLKDNKAKPPYTKVEFPGDTKDGTEESD